MSESENTPNINRAIDKLTKVVIEQAEAIERLAKAMETIAEQQRNQTYIMGTRALNAKKLRDNGLKLDEYNAVRSKSADFKAVRKITDESLN